MNDKDTLQRFIFENAPVRGQLIHLNDSFQTIITQHNYPSVMRQLLGEILVAVGLLSATIKMEGRLTVQFQGKERLKLLLAQCTHSFQLRGLAQWQGELSEAELLDQMKNGVIAILIDPDKQVGQRYEGFVEWQGSSLASSIEGYFKHSEQLPTRLWIAVNDQKAVGLLIQAMPQEGGKSISDDKDWEHIEHLTSTITSNELLTLDNQTILRRLYNQEDVRLFEPTAVSFGCTCSAIRSENALLMLGQEEVEQELKDKQKIVVKCEFCSKEYTFDRVDVARVFNPGNKPDADSSTQIH